MTRTKLGLLGLCAVVFGLMAFGATAAQADPLAKWLLAKNEAGTPLVTFLPVEAVVEKDEGSTYVLHTEISKIKVLFLCTALTSTGLKLIATGSVAENLRLIYSGCSTDLNGSASGPCVPKNKGTEEGVIETKPLHGLLKLHKLVSGGLIDDVVLILPDKVGGVESKLFVTMEFGAECAIGQKVPVIGHATIKACPGDNLLTHLLKHLVEIMPELTTLWAITETAEHVATLLGSAWIKLAGAHSGLLFSGDPE